MYYYNRRAWDMVFELVLVGPKATEEFCGHGTWLHNDCLKRS